MPLVRTAGLLALLLLPGCSYYASHKLWNGGEEVKDWKAHNRHVAAMEAYQRRPIHWQYFQGSGKEFTFAVTQEGSHVPREIAVEARGHHAELQGVTVLTRYLGNPFRPDRSASDPIASDRVRTVVQGLGWARVSTFDNVFKLQPREAIRIEVWFKVVTYFLNGDDFVQVRVLFDGSEVGSKKVTAQDAAPPSEPDRGPEKEELKRILDEQD